MAPCVGPSVSLNFVSRMAPVMKPANDEHRKEKHAANQFFSSLLGDSLTLPNVDVAVDGHASKTVDT